MANIYVGFPSHFDYDKLFISSNKKDLKGFDNVEEVLSTNYTLVMWNDEDMIVMEFDSKEELIEERDYDSFEEVIEHCNDSEPDGDSNYGMVLLENGKVIAGNENNYIEY